MHGSHDPTLLHTPRFASVFLACLPSLIHELTFLAARAMPRLPQVLGEQEWKGWLAGWLAKVGEASSR